MKNQEGGAKSFAKGMYDRRRLARKKSGEAMLKNLKNMAINYVRKEDCESAEKRRGVLRQIFTGISGEIDVAQLDIVVEDETDVKAIIAEIKGYLKYKSTLGMDSNAKSEVRTVLEQIANDPEYDLTNQALTALITGKGTTLDTEDEKKYTKILGPGRVVDALSKPPVDAVAAVPATVVTPSNAPAVPVASATPVATSTGVDSQTQNISKVDRMILKKLKRIEFGIGLLMSNKKYTN